MNGNCPAMGRWAFQILVCWCAAWLVTAAVAESGWAQNSTATAARFPEKSNAQGQGDASGNAPASAQGQNAVAGSTGASPQEGSPAGLPLEDSERHIGPLGVRGKNFTQNFTVVLHLKRVQGMESEETVARVEIRDEAGNVAYAKDIPYQVEGDHFTETNEVTARELQGSLGRGLLLSYDVEPSTPLGGGSEQVFGLFDGKLVPFSNPISFEGNLVLPEPPPEKVVKTSREPGFLGDVLQIRRGSTRCRVNQPS